MITQDTDKPTFEDMWKFIRERLAPRGTLPDKASLDYKQALELYSILLVEDMMVREMVQVALLKREAEKVKNTCK